MAALTLCRVSEGGISIEFILEMTMEDVLAALKAAEDLQEQIKRAMKGK